MARKSRPGKSESPPVNGGPVSVGVRRSFARDSGIVKWRVPTAYADPPKNRRMHRTNCWPGGRLDYEFIERCKEVVCRIAHPTNFYRWKKAEYRVSLLVWSRGGYVDIRLYKQGGPSPTGILIHQDVFKEMLPSLVEALARLEREDTREPAKKAHVEVIFA